MCSVRSLSRCPEGIELCLEAEHGFGHTSLIHSRDVRTMTEMGRAMENDAVHQERAIHGGSGPRRGRFSLLQHRYSDWRRCNQPADLHKATAVRDGRRPEGHLMRWGEVIGRTTATVKHVSLEAQRLFPRAAA
ncbi:MAG: hypothetical protein Ct9H300mP1_04050 [Planctomycetaceae bacterium]|nr:MAG: hypothetical protein Ct9H300mP1_04050 [Planctomycetaceae bacterium]